MGVFGCWAETVIIYSQLGNSSLGDEGEMKEGWRGGVEDAEER